MGLRDEEEEGSGLKLPLAWMGWNDGGGMGNEEEKGG